MIDYLQHGLTRRKARSGGWRYLLSGKTADGTRVFVTVPIVESDTDRTASKKVARAREQLDKKLNPPKDLGVFVEEYLVFKQLAPNTCKLTRSLLSPFTVEDAEANERQVRAILDSDLKPSSKNHHVKTIRAFFTWLRTAHDELGVIDPTAKARTSSKVIPRTRIPTEAETDAVLAWGIKREHKHPGSELYVRLLISTGARVSTLAALTKDSLKDGYLTLYNVKCKKPYDCRLPLKDAEIRALWGKYGDVLFPAGAERIHIALVSYMRDTFGKDADGQTISPHSFRHRVATQMLQAGVPLDVVSKVLDHATIATTLKIYASHSQHQIDQAFDAI